MVFVLFYKILPAYVNLRAWVKLVTCNQLPTFRYIYIYIYAIMYVYVFYTTKYTEVLVKFNVFVKEYFSGILNVVSLLLLFDS